jgi:hypothetical protein
MALTTPEVLSLINSTNVLKSASGTFDAFTDIVNMLTSPKILVSSAKTILPVSWWFSFPDTDTVVDDTFYLIGFPGYNINPIVSQYKNALVCFNVQGAPCVVGSGIFSGHNSPQTIVNAPTYPNLTNTIALQQATDAPSSWVGPPIKWQIFYIEIEP